MGADVTAESEDCGEVYLDDLLQSSSAVAPTPIPRFSEKENEPRSNHCQEIRHLDACAGFLHNSRGYEFYVHLSELLA